LTADIVFGGAVLVGGLATGLMTSTSALAAWSDEASARFMEISSLPIPHRLHEKVGKRIGAAMGALNPALSQQATELLAIAKNKNAKIVVRAMRPSASNRSARSGAAVRPLPCSSSQAAALERREWS
jgi:Membrane bound FAD containing D-sorbitol dehydrogenase